VRIAVCSPQVPFERGGAEILCEELVTQLRERDHEADLVTIPYKWYPGANVLAQAFLWRLVDLEEANGRPIDLVIATKFPSYVVKHRRKVVWLIHQFRQAYDFDRTELGQFDDGPKDRATRRAVHRLDKQTLGEAERLYATSSNVAERLARATGHEAQIVCHPPRELPYRCEEFGNFVLSVGRLDLAKRVDLLLNAARDANWRVVVAGDGPDRARLEAIARDLGSSVRIEFAGRVSETALADLYARCLAVYYAPIDEDSGMVPYEAFSSGKPVVTTVDAGGPLEAVENGVNGIVCDPSADALRNAVDELFKDVARAKALGERGKTLVRSMNWDNVVDTLVGL
jgi:glycosyltransferase involved in cell wall biosynthesis